ncbi:MAG: helix-turn-helix domain-containing protein [Steroidobacteraceae bacterium]
MGILMETYGQFCPIALASETLTQKWVLLIVRELNAGATRFNVIRRGLPRISATLLKQRLDLLEQCGIVASRSRNARDRDYLLTDAGRELKDVLTAVGTWGQRWARAIRDDDLDPDWLVWAMHRRFDTPRLPAKRIVIEIEFTDSRPKRRRFWFLCEQREVEVCLKNPGHEIDLAVVTPVRLLAEVWRGLRPLRAEIASGRMRLNGNPALCKAFPDWLLLSAFAKVERSASP